MAEIAGDEAPTPPTISGEVSGDPHTSAATPAGSSNKPPLRATKPGVKRLILTASVLLSFLVGLPFLLKSTEIHRSPLPSDAITALAHRLHSTPPSFPCALHAVFLRSVPGRSDDASLYRRLERSISAQLQLLAATSTAGNVSVSVTVESAGGCSSSSGSVGSGWQCGTVSSADLVVGDEVFDELLHSALGSVGGDGSRVYTVVVVEIDDADGMRVVVGKHRHAWVVGKADEVKAVSVIGKVFAKYFMNGGIEEGEAGIGKGEFMPVGSDGNVVLSFSLLNADPSDWVYDWDFEKIGEKMLNPVVEALRPIAEINIESQVLYHTPKSSYSYFDDKLGGNFLSMGDIPFFVNSNEWHLDTSISATGRSKVLQFVVYIPSARECPLYLQLPDGGLSKTNAFISPMWGGVLIWNSPDCSLGSKKTHGTQKKMSSQGVRFIISAPCTFQSAVMPHHIGVSIQSGIAHLKKPVLMIYKRLICARTSLMLLCSQVHSLPRMIVMDEIGRQVELSLEAANLAQGNATLGIISATRARALAEDAFFHPSIMSISYASVEHYFAIYMPFFAPVSLHVLLAAIKELKRYKAERAKYSAFLASQATSS
ncbi:GPI transamidase component PIG-S-related [Zea mays]|uniref:GPI transamidase component PIG-S-related n=1 Tax=Zea mays TaxID=4577 RepID=A0A1D6G6Q4_MAIZE|nr:GPI transamidase component PIG-S-related [Zea mays]